MIVYEEIRKAAGLLDRADGLIIAAGAGMGVDSGLPDFRGNEGFWRHYPAMQRAGLSFHKMAAPDQFLASPGRAWGFYGHRLVLYRKTRPHAGFGILKNIASGMPGGAFVFTSNVDGQFQKAGFDDGQIYECHGSIHYLQCIDGCSDAIWPADDFMPEVDEDACLLLNAVPTCAACSSIARPNVLMFNDYGWLAQRSRKQHRRLNDWLSGMKQPLVIELGAGMAIPTVRYFSEQLGVAVIRINLREAWLPPSPGHVSLQMRALPALEMLYQAWAGIQR